MRRRGPYKQYLQDIRIPIPERTLRRRRFQNTSDATRATSSRDDVSFDNSEVCTLYISISSL